MKTILQSLIALLIISCFQKQDASDEIKVIKLDNGKGVIFPEAFAKKIMINTTKVTGVFTPNQKLIRFIDRNLPKNFDRIITSYQKREIKLAIIKPDLGNYDKQFLGFIDKKKDSIVLGQIFNLEDYPLKKKPRFEKEYLICSDGWCDTNIIEFMYNIKTKKFSSIEE
jgi:hypothetical protein